VFLEPSLGLIDTRQGERHKPGLIYGGGTVEVTNGGGFPFYIAPIAQV